MKTKKDREQYSFIFHSWMTTELKLTGNELLVYMVIYGYTQGRQGVFFGRANFLSQILNISDDTVYKTLQKLVDRELIEKTTPANGDKAKYWYAVNHRVLAFPVPEEEKQLIPDAAPEPEPESAPQEQVPRAEIFECLWETYTRKGSKKVSRDVFMNRRQITDADVVDIVDHVPKYVESALAADERHFMKDFERYLRHRIWESKIEFGRGKASQQRMNSTKMVNTTPDGQLKKFR